jgi:DNA modification methylase
MIEMWDDVFATQDAVIREALDRQDGWAAFRAMHELLDEVWKELERVLVDGGIACINIGDATRTIGQNFALYPNHARILTALVKLGFTPLPAVLWRKQTNAPNKFMGSGMLPPGAYVTLEHEYILIVRKGAKREFLSEDARTNRRLSSFFWEERNAWFSDVWFDLKGSRQDILDRETRSRSGAFPFELPYRLISMFSVRQDTVLDPFLGVGTSMLAAMAAGRSCVGYELDKSLAASIARAVAELPETANARIQERLVAHAEFIKARHAERGVFGYRNKHHGFPVVTRQETELALEIIEAVTAKSETEFEVDHVPAPRPPEDWTSFFGDEEPSAPGKTTPDRAVQSSGRARQLDLFDRENGV